MKEKYGIHCYARYMDDSYLIHPDRAYVEEILAEIRKLANRLGICMNDRKTVIHNMKSDDFVFLKKRVHMTDNGKIILRLTRENVRQERERILAMKAEYEAGRMPKSSIQQSYNSWRGYARKYNAYRTVENMDKFFNSVMDGIL